MNQQQYKYRRSKGLCTKCEAYAGRYSLCIPCKAKFIETRKQRRNAYYRKLKEKGVCPGCQGPRDSNKIYCTECLVDQCRQLKELRNRRRKEGLCVRCKRDSPNEHLCKYCWAIESMRLKKVRRKKANENLCIDREQQQP